MEGLVLLRVILVEILITDDNDTQISRLERGEQSPRHTFRHTGSALMGPAHPGWRRASPATTIFASLPSLTVTLALADLLAGLLSHGRVAGGGHGEQQRGGFTRHQTGQVPAAPARELRAIPQIRPLR